jgi:very-short-patch-repair endonuclease
MAAHGFEVLRFWNNDVLSNTTGVLVTITRKASEITRSRSDALTRAARDLSR